MHKKTYSDFLFAQPSFLSGFGRVLDLAGTYDAYNTTSNPDDAALRADWQMIGDDMRLAFESEGLADSTGITE